jgi:hypothetical protein
LVPVAFNCCNSLIIPFKVIKLTYKI